MSGDEEIDLEALVKQIDADAEAETVRGLFRRFCAIFEQAIEVMEVQEQQQIEDTQKGIYTSKIDGYGDLVQIVEYLERVSEYGAAAPFAVLGVAANVIRLQKYSQPPSLGRHG